MNTEKYIVRLTDEERQKLETMEEVLEVDHRPPDPENPVVAMDEQPIQLLKHTRPIIPAQPVCNGHAAHSERVDYEYERIGTACVFMFVAPFENWRRVSVREHRTKRDWVEEIERLVMHDFASVKKVTIVLYNFSIVFLWRTPREHYRQVDKVPSGVLS